MSTDKNEQTIKVESNDEKKTQIKVNKTTKENKTMTKDVTFEAMNENKIEKSDRNNTILNNALKRAQKGSFDEELKSATGMDLLKVYEKFSIHEIFSIAEGKTFFKLYKEVFYINNPHKYYYETVEPTVYRRIAAQAEQGDADWAKAVAEEMKIEIVKKS